MSAAFMNGWILTVVTFLPLAGALALMIFARGDRALRWGALIVSLAEFAVSLALPAAFRSREAGFQFAIDKLWIPGASIHYHLGLDGISLWLVLLTTFLTPLSVIISWRSIHHRVKEFFVLMLLLETAMLGVFLALDMFLFYVFWEAVLIPMALVIGIWGHERRVYAAVKFFLFTMIASVFMLAAIIWLYTKTGTFDYVQIHAAIAAGRIPDLSAASLWLFLGFFIAFAVKVPLFPLHTWLPDAHVEAPTAGSVILAGVLLKMGVYGMLRFNVGLFPQEAQRQAPWILALAIIGIIYGALVAMVQPNLKKLVAYSSVSHLGFCVLGIFTFTQVGTDGAIYQMLNHGVSTGALFMLVGIIYERRHTFEISEFGGLATPMPVYSTFFMIITLASIGLPLLNGFVGEFLVLSGAFQFSHVVGVLAATGVIWSACYMLWMYQRVFFGKVTHPVNQTLPDLSGRERVALWPAAIAVFAMGVLSPIWISPMEAAVKSVLAPTVVTSAQTRPAQTEPAQTQSTLSSQTQSALSSQTQSSLSSRAKRALPREAQFTLSSRAKPEPWRGRVEGQRLCPANLQSAISNLQSQSPNYPISQFLDPTQSEISNLQSQLPNYQITQLLNPL